jgi:dethiobiotin synthetase
MVPLTRSLLSIDVIAGWRAPVILCTRTSLGTINHSLMSLEALRARDIEVLGVAFIGEANEDTEATICALGRVRRLGRLPFLDRLDTETLADSFDTHFNRNDFRVMSAGHAES